jgi:hypothetical protein
MQNALKDASQIKEFVLSKLTYWTLTIEAMIL